MQVNLPKEFSERIHQQFGDQADDFLKSLTDPIPTSLRLNPLKHIAVLENHFENSTPIPWCTEGLYLAERPQFIFDPLFHAGCYYVQEASSMFLSHLLKYIIPSDKDIIALDLCAAPGGKSTLINSLISENSLLVANEVIRSRAGILEENLTKWGYSNFMITSNDPKDFNRIENLFDLIVIDAPCSGEGMFRKDPGAIKEWSEANVDLCASRQQRIISDVINSLKPGGYLVYSTCTFAPQENEENCSWMIEAYNLEPIQIPILSEWNVAENQKSGFGYHFYPNKTKGEGLFMSCFRKPEEELQNNKPGKDKKLDFLSKKLVPEASKWLKQPEKFDFIVHDGNVYALPLKTLSQFYMLHSKLYIAYAGLCIGKLMGEQILPSHELALNSEINPDLPSIEFSKEQAQIYLKKGDVSNFEPVVDIPNGWTLITYENHPLGWIKKIGNRTNNYFPKDLRILKDLK